VAACALADVLPTQCLLLLRLELLILGSFPVCFLESAWWASQLISGLYCPGVIVLAREDGYFSLYMSGLSGRHLQCDQLLYEHTEDGQATHHSQKSGVRVVGGICLAFLAFANLSSTASSGASHIQLIMATPLYLDG